MDTQATNLNTSSRLLEEGQSIVIPSHRVIPVSIISSSKMSQKIRLLLDSMVQPQQQPSSGSKKTKVKPAVIALHANADVASKLISIVELAKRQIEKDEGKWYQYSTVDGRLIVRKQKSVQKTNSGHVAAGKGSNQQDHRLND